VRCDSLDQEQPIAFRPIENNVGHFIVLRDRDIQLGKFSGIEYDMLQCGVAGIKKCGARRESWAEFLDDCRLQLVMKSQTTVDGSAFTSIAGRIYMGALAIHGESAS
jgi:hypothetical protein